MMDKEQGCQDQQPEYSNEIDILRFCMDLWERRFLIMICILLVTSSGLSYAFLSAETFKAEVRLYPSRDIGLPKTSFLSNTSKYEEDISEYFFRLVQQYLTSQTTFIKVVNNSDIATILDKGFPNLTNAEKAQELSKRTKVILPSLKKETEFITAELEWSDPVDVTKLTNAWVSSAVAEAKSELIKSSLSRLNREIKWIDQLIALKQEHAKNQINKEIFRLKEAKAVFNQIDVLKTAGNDDLLSVTPEYANIKSLRALYLVGGDALDAEIRALESRKDRADYYVPGLLGLEEQKAELMSVPLNESFINLVSGNWLSTELGVRVGPNHKLIVGVSLLLGLMLGFVLALIKIDFDSRALAK
jgi:LPS O-antigen subunit length determinant protein (WzzB/FepE family)